MSVSAGDVIPEKTVVSGFGSTLVAGRRSVVRVELLDRWGNRDVPQGVNCSVSIRSVSGTVTAFACARSIGCGLPFCERISAGCFFTANVTASEAGLAQLDVVVNSVTVFGGGRSISVVPGPPSAEFSVVSANLVASSQLGAGGNIDVNVTLRDAFNNSVSAPPGPADVTLETSLDTGECVLVKSVESGSLSEEMPTFSHRPVKAGNLTLWVLVNGEAIPGFRKVVSITPGPTAAWNSDTTGDIHTALAGVPTFFTVRLRDRFGNPQSQPGDSVNASFLPVTGATPPEFSPVESLGLSAFRLGYTVYNPELNGGLRVLNVTVTSANGSVQPVSGSPFLVTVRRGPAVANLSSVSVLNPINLTLPVIPTGQSLQLAVILRDARGNAGPSKEVSDEPVLTFSANPQLVNETRYDSPTPLTSLSDLGNGTVIARFMPYRPGNYSLVFQLGGRDIGLGGSLVVTVTQGDVAPDQTVIYGAANGEPLIASLSPEVSFCFSGPVSIPVSS